MGPDELPLKGDAAMRPSTEAERALAPALIPPTLFSQESQPFFSRIVETVDASEGQLNWTVSAMVRLPSGYSSTVSESTVAIPLIYARKDRLLSQMDVDAPGSLALVVLPRAEASSIAVATIAAAWRTYIDPWLPYDSSVADAQLLAALELPLLDKRTAVRRYSTIMNRIRAIAPLYVIQSPRANDHFIAMAKVLRFFATKYILWVQVRIPPSTEHLLLKYRYSVEFDVFASSSASLLPRRLYRLFLPSPYRFIMPLPLAQHAESYHFQLTAPSGQYVVSRDPRLVATSAHAAEPPVSLARHLHTGGAGHTYTGSPTGFQTCHVYLGGLDHKDARSIFRERRRLVVAIHLADLPPGLLGVAAWTLMALLVVVGAVAANYRTLVEGSNDPSNLVAVVVALPGIVAALSRHRISAREFERPTVLARICLFYTALGSLCVTAAVLLRPKSEEPLITDYLGSRWVLVAVCGGALLLLIVTGLRIARAFRVFRRARRQPADAKECFDIWNYFKNCSHKRYNSEGTT